MRKSQDFPSPGFGHKRVFAQMLLIDGPFHPAQAEGIRPGEFLTPFIPGERLDLSLNQCRQPSLHEADAFAWRLHGLSPVLIARPFAVHPPSTNNSWPVT